MPDQPHLPFRRVARPARPRRRVRRNFRRVTQYEDRAAHAADIEQRTVDSLAALEVRQAAPEVFDPKLILQFSLNARVSDDVWRQTGLTVLDSSDTDAAVVFSADAQLLQFREKLEAYARGIRPGAETAAFEALFDAIDDLGPVIPEQRLTQRLRSAFGGQGPALAMDIEFWFVGDLGLLQQWVDQARRVVAEQGGEWLDELLSPSAGIALARIRGTREVAEAVAQLDQVVLLDAVPDPRLPRGELAELQVVDAYPEVRSPDEDAPVVGVIDSGLLVGHPLLEAAVAEAVALHPEFGDQAEDVNGHGTFVSGRVLYGDVLSNARAGVFEPAFWLASVRVLDDDARAPVTANWVKLIAEAVEYLATEWGARVINLSIGDATSPFAGGKSTPLAAALDSLARTYDLVLVISAGNVSESALRPLNTTLRRYPRYLLDGGYEILDPAQAALGITVGALAEADGVAPRELGERLGEGAVARADGPAPYTRSGPGVRKAIKPELAADGGNWVFDRLGRRLVRDPAVEVLSTSHRYPASLFATGAGTSFAAPAVTHIAGRLAAEYPSLTGSTIRALLLQGAVTRPVTREVIQDESDLWHLCGFGSVNWERSGESADNRVVLYAEDSLRVDDFHVYRIPILSEFTDVRGEHRLAVSLAYSPPVRHRRFDYLAFGMEFIVLRGVPLADIFEMAGADVEDPDAGNLRAYELPNMRPPRTVRARGCNQVGYWSSPRRPAARFHDDWYVVVRSLNRWMPRDAPAQPYSLAISVEVEEADELYAQLVAELEIELELEA